MKYLLWQFSAYAAVALVLGIVVGRWSMSARVSIAERDRQRAAFELSALTTQASSLLEESGRERSSIVDANSRLAEDLRVARDSQLRIRAELNAAELLRTRSVVALRAAHELPMTARCVPEPLESTNESSSVHPDLSEEVLRLTNELADARTELLRRATQATIALAAAEARARDAEQARLDLSRVHAASVRAAQAELTRAVLRAERAEALPGWRGLASRPNSPVQVVAVAETGTVSTERILDLRPFDHVEMLDRPVE